MAAGVCAASISTTTVPYGICLRAIPRRKIHGRRAVVRRYAGTRCPSGCEGGHVLYRILRGGIWPKYVLHRRVNHVGKVSLVTNIARTPSFARPIAAHDVDVKDFNSIEWQDDRQPAIARRPMAAPTIAEKIVRWRIYFASLNAIGACAGGIGIPRLDRSPRPEYVVSQQPASAFQGDIAFTSSVAALDTVASCGVRVDPISTSYVVDAYVTST